MTEDTDMANIIEKASKKFKGERTLSTIIIVVFMILYWVITYTPYRAVFTSMTALVALLATYELINSVGCKNRILYIITMTYSAVQVFLISYKVDVKWNIVLTAYILALLILTVATHEKTKYTDVCVAVMGSVAYSYAFSCFILIRDFYIVNPAYSKQDCFWLFLASFGASWLTDAGAFLVGRKFGKHKLCPKISPKKSVEGAIGGVIVSVFFANLVYFIYDTIINAIYGSHTFGGGIKRFLVLSAILVVLDVLSMFGDLAASVHKRNYGLKDYSNLLPGHGGIMDRFDSSIFVLPAMYAIISSIPNLF